MWIFLDFDGVLNSRRYAFANPLALKAWFGDRLVLDRQAMEILNEILRQSGARVVISSAWRKRYNLDQLREKLRRGGMAATERVVSMTPNFGERPRGHEIYAWWSHHGGGRPFAILDDRSDMQPCKSQLVLTKFNDGLQPRHVGETLRVLSAMIRKAAA